ncbi:hypothetical protein RY831_21100 [Noviherbaspirillum sp. CPCC 100848]|uniref:Uncharacterized protein n=1 Tax=Noviherbaspirillum album TaxID=3080276 RepID=A0ABU6JDE6_9BURK|nr:hypothetical protein [Noviherbaspirillum sp. CPCC 100848]MEC4721670.1 hypothetical protein [Noviherbaspirillum sp. CPCC 100848]
MRISHRHQRRPFVCIALLAGLLLSGCGGYARNNGSNAGGGSSIEVYGVIDAGIQRERTR